MDDIQRAIRNLSFMKVEIEGSPKETKQMKRITVKTLNTAISAIEELQQYRERIEQLKHTEVRRFECKLPDGRICHFTDFVEFLEKGEVV